MGTWVLIITMYIYDTQSSVVIEDLTKEVCYKTAENHISEFNTAFKAYGLTTKVATSCNNKETK